MELKPYPKYKDSGIEWLGEIPEEWEVIRLRNTINYKKGKNPTILFENNINNKYLPYLSMDYLRNNEDEIHFVEKSIDTVIANKGDILLLWDGSNAGEFIVSKDGAVSSTMAKIFPEINLDKRFCFFLCKTIEPILRDHTIGMGIPHVNANILKNIVCPFPSRNEQTAVAVFLDQKTAKIDGLIEKNERLIELLKEKRQAVISHTVTKGIPPHTPLKKGGWGDLKMKDSGIEWIGKIPEGWKVKRLKYVAKIILGKMLQNENTGDDELKPYLRAQNIQWESVDTKDIKEMWVSAYEIKKYRLQTGDLLVSEGGEVGRAAIWNDELKECYIQNSVHKITVKNNLFNNKYLLYLLETYGKRGFFEAIVSRVSIGHLTREKLKEIEIICPLKREQYQIVDYLDKKTTEIDELIQKIQSQISTLKEYRQALISNVVTGKMRVGE